MKRVAFLFSFLFLTSAPAFAAIIAEPVEYKDGDTTLQGFIAYDDATEAKRPGVLVVHEWKGPGSYTERRVRQLAELGYVAFAVDMYGKGVRPQTHEEAAKVSGIYRSDRDLMRSRAKAGLTVLKDHPLVDSSKMAAIGYCFGGATVLELARAGEDLKGVVSFHGALTTPKPAAPGAVKAKVLVLRGGKDAFVTPEEVEVFKREMKDAGADFREEVYPDAVHSFTVEEAGTDVSKGMAYNAEADKQSWEAMKTFFGEIFQS
jgi:dienelactone hydrolase